jgi:N-acetylglucosaminyl-diphospho-decaprenol L-rhamnosyltransferase
MAEPKLAVSASSQPHIPAVKIGVVTVTYNSGPFFDEYMRSLEAQTRRPDLVVLVDSGSSEPGFLESAAQYAIPLELLRESNVGVCVGNNIGWRRLRGFDYVIFLNPDAFLTSDFIERAVAYMEEEPKVGMVTPSLLRYDIENHRPLDIIDTTGVVRNWLGLLKERDQSKPAQMLKRYTSPSPIPWLCTAVAMGRREAMESVVERGDQLFDESFFMYKDDTDLSWRVRRAGWSIIHHPALVGYHCRGWQDRRSVSRRSRVLTARNEVKMCLKNRSPFVAVAVLKYLLVRAFNL